MMANSSMNFFIYCFMSSIFREVLFDNLAYYGQIRNALFSAIRRFFGSLRTCFRQTGPVEVIEVNDNKMVVSASLNLIGENIDMTRTAYHQDNINGNGNAASTS